MPILLDTHVVHWWSAEPGRVSQRAAEAIASADELVVADISWFELAWLAHRGRIEVAVPVGAWLERISRFVRTAPVTPRVAAGAVALADGFPGDPADRLIYATALDNGWNLVTKDQAFRRITSSAIEVIW